MKYTEPLMEIKEFGCEEIVTVSAAVLDSHLSGNTHVDRQSYQSLLDKAGETTSVLSFE